MRSLNQLGTCNETLINILKTLDARYHVGGPICTLVALFCSNRSTYHLLNATYISCCAGNSHTRLSTSPIRSHLHYLFFILHTHNQSSLWVEPFCCVASMKTRRYDDAGLLSILGLPWSTESQKGEWSNANWQ